MRAELSEIVSIKSVFLHVTKACNLRCAYCYFSADRPMPSEMTTDEYARLWPDLAALRPGKIVITGGEPLLRRDLLEMLRGWRSVDPGHEIRLCVNTNGHLVTERLAQELVGLADEVRVSLDGDDATNDSLRGEGNAAAARRALDLFHQAGFEPKILVTVTAANLPGLPDFLYTLADEGLTRLSLNIFRPIGRGAGEDAWRIEVRDIRRALRDARRRLLPDEPDLPEPAIDGQHHCGAGHFLNVLPNGDVFPCHALTDPRFACGNVRHDALSDMCRRSGLLGRLSDLNYHRLAADHPPLARLERSGACLGEVHSKTSPLVFWRELTH